MSGLDKEKAVTNTATADKKEVNPMESIVSENNEAADPIAAAVPVSPFRTNEDGEKIFTSPTGRTFFIGSGGICAEIGDSKRRPISSLIEVIGEGCTEEGSDYRRLVRFSDPAGRPHEMLIEKGQLATNAGAIVRELVNNGLDVFKVTSQGGNVELVDYLLNCPVTSRFLSLPSLGWYKPGKVFVIPQANGTARVIGNHAGEELRYSGRFDATLQGATGGTLEQWQKTVGKNAKHSSRVMFALSLAFASPLLIFSNESTGGFHLFGPSSKGKSTALRALSSVWQQIDPNGNGGLEQWDSTKNGLEAGAAAWSDFPLPIDELGNTEERQKKNIQAVIYMLGNGLGKGRQSKTLEARKRLSWRLLFLSSGELTAEELSASAGVDMAAGASVRLANIQAVPAGSEYGIFESVPEGMAPAALAASFVENGSKYYGTAGPAFIEALIAETEKRGGFEYMKGYVCERIEQWANDHGAGLPSQALRVAKRFALVATAGELAIKYGVLPWDAGEADRAAAACFRSFVENFESSEEKQRLIALLPFTFIEGFPGHFAHFTAAPNSFTAALDPRPFAGYVLTNASANNNQFGAPCLAFFTSEGFKKMCSNNRKAESEILAALKDQGVLIRNNGEKLKYKINHGRTALDVVPHGYYYVVFNPDEYSAEVREHLIKNAEKLAEKVEKAIK